MAQQQLMHMSGAYGAVPLAAATPTGAAAVPQPFLPAAPPLLLPAVAPTPSQRRLRARRWQPSQQAPRPLPCNDVAATAAAFAGGSWPIHSEVASADTAEGAPSGSSGSTLGSAGEHVQLPIIDDIVHLDDLGRAELPDLDDWELASPLWEALLSPRSSATAPGCTGTGGSPLGCAGTTAS